ncbi:MAG: ketoacyl-ACP synthase III [Planctomycetes bacterium]|nr:ketoacyl-ACP synthase III [Planctomycetota bacterium]
MAALKRVGIFGTGTCLPSKVLTNQELATKVETSDEWIQSRTGIRERRVLSPGQYTSDLAAEAGRRALEMAGLAAEELDMIVVGTCTPDNLLPNTACHVQHKLGAANSAAVDVNAACTGFLYSLAAGTGMVANGTCRNALVIGAESLSTIVDYTDRNSCVIFGDGAGAAVLRETDGPREVLASFLGAKGDVDGCMLVPAGGARMPATHATVDGRKHFIQMKGREVYEFAVRKMVAMTERAAAHAGVQVKDLACIVPHQVNLRILESAAKRLELPMDKLYVNIDRYGNTSAASVPIALDEAHRQGRFKSGDLICLVAFGAGLTWASSLLRW